MTTKEKLLASAQKNLLKGQLLKAIKDYEALVQVDPKELRHRQKLAELYTRAKLPAQAIEELQKIAKYYTDNGFFLKAIAVFKQIQRTDPSLLDVYVRLAELNEKQGLVGNALAEYRSLVGHYERLGQNQEIVRILERMKNIDPENLNIRVKLAETFAKQQRRDEALADFRDVLSILQSKKDLVKILKLHEIFIGFFPEEPSIKIGLGAALVQSGDADRGLAVLLPLLDTLPNDPLLLRRIADGYRRQGAFDKEQEFYGRLVALCPGDLELRQLQIQAGLDGGRYASTLDLVEAAKTAFLEQQRLTQLKDYYERLRRYLPDEPRIIDALHTLYEATGNGAKLFDMLAETPASSGAAEPPGPAVVAEGPLDLELDGAAETDAGPAFAAEEEESEEIPLEFLQDVEELPEIITDTESSLGSASLQELASDDPDGTAEAVAAPLAELESLEFDADELSLSFDEELPGLETGDGVGAAHSQRSVDLLQDLPEFQLDAAEAVDGLLPAAAGAETANDDFFDFSSEILAELDDGVDVARLDAPRPTAPVRSPAEAPVHRGVKTQGEIGDAESHFNLGIAYREMGLIDDAIGEFDQAMVDVGRQVDCLTLKGICLVDKQEFGQAEAAFKQGLATPALTGAQKASLLFEMGLLYEAWGRPLDALDSFQSVADLDAFFRNVQEKSQELRKRLGMEEPDDNDRRGGGNDRISYV